MNLTWEGLVETGRVLWRVGLGLARGPGKIPWWTGGQALPATAGSRRMEPVVQLKRKVNRKEVRQKKPNITSRKWSWTKSARVVPWSFHRRRAMALLLWRMQCVPLFRCNSRARKRNAPWTCKRSAFSGSSEANNSNATLKQYHPRQKKN